VSVKRALEMHSPPVNEVRLTNPKLWLCRHEMAQKRERNAKKSKNSNWAIVTATNW